MHFSDRLAAVIHDKNSCLMLGLDPNWEKLPASLKTEKPSLQQKADIYEKFCTDMVDACADKVCGVKIQMGYFEALGSVGVKAVENIIAFVRTQHPELIIMMDAKRGDIGSTSEAYAEAFLGKESPLSGDCVTVAPYMGVDSVNPFVDLENNKDLKGVFVLVKTSNLSSQDIQDREFTNDAGWKGSIAENWAGSLNDAAKKKRQGNTGQYSALGAVVGATHPEELPKFRKILKSCWMLCPGVGAQGGKIEDVLAIRDEDGLGVLIPVSRGILYAGNGDDYLAKAKEAVQALWEAQKM